MNFKQMREEKRKRTWIKDEALIHKVKPWEYFYDSKNYDNYYYHDRKRILFITKTMELPHFILSTVFFLAKTICWFQKIFHKMSRLIKYPLYMPVKFFLPVIRIAGWILYHICYNRFSEEAFVFMRTILNKAYHFSCEVIASVILNLAGVPFLVWIGSRLSVFFKYLFSFFVKIKEFILFEYSALICLLAGRPSLLYTIPLLIKAVKIKQSGKLKNDVVKTFLDDYSQPSRQSKEYFPDDSKALFVNTHKHNSLSLILERIDKGIILNLEDYNSLFCDSHSPKDIIETYTHLLRLPNPIAYSAISFLIHSLPKNQKLPVNPRISDMNKAYMFFNKKNTNTLTAEYVLIIPVGYSDLKRIETGKLSARIMEAHLALTGRKMSVFIILPCKSTHNNELYCKIENTLKQCWFPENVSWEIMKPSSDISIASVRGFQMLWALNYIASNDKVRDDTVVILSEMVSSVNYFNIRHMSQALLDNTIVTASRHVIGSRTLNKSIPDKFNSLIYNTYARILIPGNWSDSSAPIKLFFKKTLKPLMPYIKICAQGMLDFGFDEGFLAVCYNMSVKVIQKPIFWSDVRGIGGAERTKNGIRSQLAYTKILGRKIRFLRQIRRLKTEEKIFLGGGMDFSVSVTGDLAIIKTPTRPLNSLEILIASHIKKAVDHNRFGFAGRLAMKILPDYVSKRIGVIAEGKFRNPAARLETLFALISNCPVVEKTQLIVKKNDFYLKQQIIPLLLGDVLNLNTRNNNTEGIKSILDYLIQLNEILHKNGLFDSDFRSLKDVGISIADECRVTLLDFADLIYRKEKAVQITETLPEILNYRRDFLYIKKICLSNPEWARVYFTWYENLANLYKKENIEVRWNSERTFCALQLPLFQIKKDKSYLQNITLMHTENISRMADRDHSNAQIAMFPPMETDYTIPNLPTLPIQWGSEQSSSLHSSTIVFLSNDTANCSLIASFMAEYLPAVKYYIFKDKSPNENLVKRLRFKSIISQFIWLKENIVVIPLDGQSNRMRAIMSKELTHKSFIRISSYPLLYWILISVITFLDKYSSADDLVMYLHGDTITSFGDEMPKPALYIPKRITRIGRALQKESTDQNFINSEKHTRIWGKLLQAHRQEGYEFPGAFILNKSMIPLLIETSLNSGNFSENVAKMTRHIKNISYKTMPAFYDCDNPYTWWRLNLMTFLGRKSEEVVQYDGNINLIQNRIFIQHNSKIRIISETKEAVKVELCNVVVIENSSIDIIIPNGMKSVKIFNAVFTESTGKFRMAVPSINGTLAANFSDGITELLPLTFYGIDGLGHPLCPELTNEE